MTQSAHSESRSRLGIDGSGWTNTTPPVRWRCSTVAPDARTGGHVNHRGVPKLRWSSTPGNHPHKEGKPSESARNHLKGPDRLSLVFMNHKTHPPIPSTSSPQPPSPDLAAHHPAVPALRASSGASSSSIHTAPLLGQCWPTWLMHHHRTCNGGKQNIGLHMLTQR